MLMETAAPSTSSSSFIDPPTLMRIKSLQIRARVAVQGFIKGAFAAAIGTILGACVLLSRIAIGDWFTILVAVMALAALFRWKLSNPLLMAVSAVAGLIAFPLLHPVWVMVR